MDNTNVVSDVICNELILRHILRYLLLRDLNKVRTVCKLWNQLVDREVKRRVLFERWFYGFVTRPPSAHFAQRRLPPTQEPNDVYIGSTFESVSQYLKRTAINDLWIKPKNGLLFHGGFCPSSAKITQLLEYNLFLKYIPNDCQLMIVNSSAGLLSSSKHFAVPMEIQAHYAKLAALSYLFTPEFNLKHGCGIKIFDENDTLDEFSPKKPDHKKLKALWIFTISQENKELQNVENMIESYEGRLAVWRSSC
ncbi:hypothetical protein B4U80_14931 [Leptotrombidium deliense]|uniref:F-box domain-containing protein n=1 Tax=Leptotrombidium deliense TaxID=299467 RepID=A0A443RZM6_9ACAR|nr:hypothetical protein B4U80_14931 [Leptotrombidium deliense]